MKIKSVYLFYIIIILITFFLFYYIYNKYNNNILRKNIVKKLNNSYELFNNIKNKEFFLNNNQIKNNIHKKNNKINYTIEYSYYKSNKYDTYDMLNRDLILYGNKSDIQEDMTTQEQNMNDLFPDLNKSEFSMDQNQKTSDLLIPQEFEPDKTVMSDALLKMDTRPDEQKELDSLLDDLNIYIYLLKNSILSDLNNKRDIAINQKISLYYNLFKDSLYMAKDANDIYNGAKETPNYTTDSNLDKRIELYLTKSDNLSLSIMTIYGNILSKKDVDKNKDLLIKLNIPIPPNLDAEEESDNVDPLSILRDFADNINDMYDSLNTIIAPYYNFVFELAIAPYPRDDDAQDPNSPDNKAGAALISSFMTEMLSFSSSYNDAMINYIMNENIYTSLIVNKDYKSNLLKLPNLSSESIVNINELYTKKIIDDNQISSFDKTVQDVTIVYNYFMALYYLMKANPDPEKLDTDTIEKILKGTITFNTKDRFSLLKKYDPTVDNDEYTYSIKNMVTNNEYIFVSSIIGFTTEKSVPSGPSKDSINKAKQNLSKQISKVFTNVGNDIAKGATQAANVVAKETTQIANEVAKGTTQVANEVAKGTTQAANVVAKETTQIANEVAKGTTEVVKDIGKGATKVANKIGKAFKKIKI